LRCADGYREGTKSMRRCVYRKQLDLETLVTTRGPNFPLSRLESRLICPALWKSAGDGRVRTADQQAGPWRVIRRGKMTPRWSGPLGADKHQAADLTVGRGL
jgi:hypothetical protein